MAGEPPRSHPGTAGETVPPRALDAVSALVSGEALGEHQHVDLADDRADVEAVPVAVLDPLRAQEDGCPPG